MFGFGVEAKEEIIERDAVNAAIRERLRGKLRLFGFGMKAKERAVIIKGAITDVVLSKMGALLVLVTHELGVAEEA